MTKSCGFIEECFSKSTTVVEEDGMREIEDVEDIHLHKRWLCTFTADTSARLLLLHLPANHTYFPTDPVVEWDIQIFKRSTSMMFIDKKN